jgi:hypothetical protein
VEKNQGCTQSRSPLCLLTLYRESNSLVINSLISLLFVYTSSINLSWSSYKRHTDAASAPKIATPTFELILRLGPASPRLSNNSIPSTSRLDAQGIVEVAVGKVTVVVCGTSVVTVVVMV